jgi:hypothetical protein
MNYDDEIKLLKEKTQEIINTVNMQNWLADNARKHIIDIKQALLQVSNLQHKCDQLTNILFPCVFYTTWINEYFKELSK